jgi:D-3-phosphoglycerate dehydrogenase
MSSFTVVIMEPGYVSYEIEKAVLTKIGATICPLADYATQQEKDELLARADILMVRETPLPAELINKSPYLKGIARYGVGYDNVDIEYARSKHIPVSNVADYGASESVAEFAVGLMLAASRSIVSRDKAVRQGGWDFWQHHPVHQLRGRTAGIVGLGLIGCGFARKISGLGFARLLAFDPYAEQKTFATYHAESVDLNTLCAQSDVISLHAPLNASTRHMINAQRLSLMQPTTILINTARGALIDGQALYHALHDKKIFAAALDTHETEPFPADYPLLTLENCIVTDHTAWYTVETCKNMQYGAATEVLRMLQGAKPIHWVNPW